MLFVAFGAFAQTAPDPPSNYTNEYLKRLKVYQTVQPYGDKPFGEDINLYTGEVSFSHTDIVLEGIGPTIRVTRTRRGTGRDEAAEELHPASMFGDWTLDLPRIDTLVADPRYVDDLPGINWRMDATKDAESYKRCTYFNPPYVGQSGILQEDWWHGYEITLGGGGESLLARNPVYQTKPAMAGAFPALTLSDVQVTCLPATKNGEVGEGFLAIAPDGTKYWFDWLVGSKGTTVLQQHPQTPMSSAAEEEVPADAPSEATEAEQQAPVGGTAPLQQDRMQVSMFVTKIEDRFGNVVNYTYTPGTAQLASITASDGRNVTFAWNGTKIASITAMPNTADVRTWQYQYPNGNLGVVILPDQSRWTFNLGNLGGSDGAEHPTTPNSCALRTDLNTPGSDATSEISTVTAPSGLVGTFAMQKRWHGRSYIGSTCVSGVSGSYEPLPPVYGTRSLYKRAITGIGVPGATWTYLYAPAAGSTRTDACYSANTCSDTTWIDVVEPSGERTRYTSGTRFDALEGKLLRTDMYGADGTLLRYEVSTYTLPASGLPYFPNIGYANTGGKSNEAKTDNRTPLRHRLIRQQSRSFNWIVDSDCGVNADSLCFDDFARPRKITRNSTP